MQDRPEKFSQVSLNYGLSTVKVNNRSTLRSKILVEVNIKVKVEVNIKVKVTDRGHIKVSTQH